MFFLWITLWVIVGMAWVAAVFAACNVLYWIYLYIAAGIDLAVFFCKTMFGKDTDGYKKKEPSND